MFFFYSFYRKHCIVQLLPWPLKSNYNFKTAFLMYKYTSNFMYILAALLELNW